MASAEITRKAQEYLQNEVFSKEVETPLYHRLQGRTLFDQPQCIRNKLGYFQETQTAKTFRAQSGLSIMKKLMEDSTGMKMTKICGRTLDEGAIADAQWMKDNGHTFYVLPKEEKDRWRQKLKGIHEETLANLEAQGIKNVRAIYDEAMRLAEKFSNETEGGYK